MSAGIDAARWPPGVVNPKCDRLISGSVVRATVTIAASARETFRTAVRAVSEYTPGRSKRFSSWKRLIRYVTGLLCWGRQIDCIRMTSAEVDDRIRYSTNVGS